MGRPAKASRSRTRVSQREQRAGLWAVFIFSRGGAFQLGLQPHEQSWGEAEQQAQRKRKYAKEFIHNRTFNLRQKIKT